MNAVSLVTTSNYLKLTLSNTTFATDEVDKKRELKRFASSVPVLKDCMNFGRLFNVAAKRASK
ncbi:hypothetical protein ALT1000_40169 [Alteromonas macleodii]